MPPASRRDIPEDVWIEIVQYITARQDAHSLSFTCKVIRDATLPLLFRTLSFDASRHPKPAWQSFLYGSSRRADSLLSLPHLLDHVREVHLGLRKSVRGTLWRTTSDKISTIILVSPHIWRLSLESCIITPGLHEVIHRKASLRSLEVFRTGGEVSPLLRPCPVAGVTRLSYKGSPDSSPSWFLQLLDCCLSTLISLTVDDEEVFTHFLSISGRQSLALRTLVVSGYNSFPENYHRDVWNLSIMCPELRTLRLPPFVNCRFPDDALPKLEVVEGSLPLLSNLIAGRDIHTVNLTHINNPMSPGDATLLRAGKAPVRHLTIRTFVQFQDGGIKHVAAALGELFSLSVGIELFLRSVDNFDELLDSVTDCLPQWPQLQIYRIYSEESFAAELSQKYSQFPIAPSGDPSNRGHPSLIEFQFLTDLAWLWLPDEGWTLRKVDGPQFTLHS